MRLRNLTQRDRYQAGKPCLRGEQVIGRCVQLPRCDVEANREQVAVRVVDQPEIRVLGDGGGTGRQALEAGGECRGPLSGVGQGVPEFGPSVALVARVSGTGRMPRWPGRVGRLVKGPP
jgi:hypothetical protein